MTDQTKLNTTAPMAATLSPRERVAAMIDDLAACGTKGEDILKRIEGQTVGFSSRQLKLAFFWAKFTDSEMGEGA